MRKMLLFILLLAITGLTNAQTSFQTVVPSLPVVAGEAFRVQYVLKGEAIVENFTTPDFRPFRMVTGPDIYNAESQGVIYPEPSKNYVFTLVAPKPGKYKIPGALVKYDGRQVRSNEVLVDVVSKEVASKIFGQDLSSDYILRPGENVQEKIRQNLFVKVSVNKKTCYAGEPVMATFKLYSRLESRSDIVKNPGFYGFTIYDMVNLQDKIVATENINGRIFDVHTIRQVQLYPLQAGTFFIDAMQVKNKVEFSKSAVSKRTEQEISEGLLGIDVNDEPAEGTEVFETNMSTEPLTIVVKPLPERNKPPGFTGATGKFTIAATLVKNELAKNEEGFLDVTITGKGNFIQLEAPSIQWPTGIEGFEPVLKDELDKTSLPLSGTRTFRYPFVCATAGTYELPPIAFSFFNTDSNTFSTVVTKGIKAVVNNIEKKSIASSEGKTSINAASENAARTAAIIVAILVLSILAYWSVKKKETPKVISEVTPPALPSIQSLLAPAVAANAEGSPAFFREIHQAIWNFLQQRFGFTGSEMNKQVVLTRMNAAGINSSISTQLMSILEQSEAGIFTNAIIDEDREVLLNTTMEVLENIDQAIQ